MKKKIFAIVLCVAMLAIAIVGGTMAYFTDTHAQTNTFVAGQVGISLDEAKVKLDNDSTSTTFGDLIADGTTRTTETQEYKLFPGMTVTKDPTITVDESSEDAYVAAKITITGELYDLIGINGYDTLNVHALASGGLLADQDGAAYGNYNGLFVFQNDNYAIHQVADKAKNTWTLYIFMKATQAAESEIVLFDTLTIPATYDNAEMAKINGMAIKVEAYATQTNGFADCYAAMTTAFPNAFSFN